MKPSRPIPELLAGETSILEIDAYSRDCEDVIIEKYPNGSGSLNVSDFNHKVEEYFR